MSDSLSQCVIVFTKHIMAERTQHSGEDSSSSPPRDEQGAPAQAEGKFTEAVEAAAAAAEAERPAAGVEASPSPPAELAQLFELPDMLMKVAAFVGVPVLGLLACTASHFRAVLPTCVSISAATALNPVCVEEQPVTSRVCVAC